MKKTITPLLCAIILVLANFGAVFAQPGTFYEKYHVNQNFDDGVLPDGWVQTNQNANDANSLINPAAIFARSGGQGLKNGMYNWVTLASGNQFRGADLRFPSTNSNPEFAGETTWFIEFDWNTVSATLTHGNALSLILCGSNSINIRNATTWYADAILGIFVMGDNKFHYWNQDLIGYPKPDATGIPVPGEYMGPAFLAGQYPIFNRVWSTSTATSGINVDSTWKANEATLTNVTYANGKTFHIKAELNFTTQKVVSLTITDKDDPLNTATILDKPFLAPTTAGSVSTVPLESRIVQDMSIINVGDNRSTNSGNVGGGSVHDTYIDNLGVYVMVESQGKADLTVKYLDQNGETVKVSSVMTNQEVGNIYKLTSADKENVITGTDYYAYDADQTHAANTRGVDGESITLDLDGDTLTVKFKKSTKTDGTYLWTGASSSNWDELSDNFSVNGGAAQSYQAGNAALFAEAAAPYKEIVVDGTIDLGASSVTVLATDYVFGGNGKLTGTGNFLIDVSTTLAVNNLMDGGAVINTTSPVSIKHATAAKNYTVATDGATLKMGVKSGENNFVALPVTGNGGALNLVIDSIAPHSLNVTNVPTLNVLYNQEGRLKAPRWTTTLGGTVTKGSQVNVTTSKTDFILPTGFSVGSKTLDSVKVNLGNHVRVLRDYNENANGNDVLYIGELTGSATSYLEGGWIDGRCMGYNIGSLGTDAVFDGGIRPYQNYKAATDTTLEVVTPSTSGIRLTKVGAGSLTINGVITLPNSTQNGTTTIYKSYNSITAQQGTLVLGNKVYFPNNDTIAHVVNVKPTAKLVLKDSLVAPVLNAITLTVDTTATLKANNSFVGSYFININGTLEDGLKAVANLTISKTATVKLDVANFTDTYEKAEAAGDLKVDSANLEITVTASTLTKGDKIALFTSSNSDIRFRTVSVNGDVIVSDGLPVAGKDYVWVYDTDYGMFTGELLYDGTTGIKDIYAGKEIRNIKYFDVTGRPVTEPTEESIVIKKTTYTDGTVRTEKTFINRK